MKYVPRYFFCNLEGHFKSDCSQEKLSGVKASRARLMNEAESRKKKLTQGTLTTEKVKTLPDDTNASSLEAESTCALYVDYGLAARTALRIDQQELATKEVEHYGLGLNWRV